ncbi:hypothetical protein [Saccharopolyspora sp. NPDC050642]|uniref:hypothetical protein n=1 Tax=Saccharopolyspora sp. NPDC050642 TaxID=3157099 RepID=UPI0033E169AF
MNPQQPDPSGQPQYQPQQPPAPQNPQGQPVPQAGQPVPPPGQPVPQAGQPFPQPGQAVPPPGQPFPQPGYPVPPPPKKKSRVGCILAVILVSIPMLLIGLVGGGYLYFRHQHVTEPAGQAPSGEPMVSECDLLSEKTLRDLHTTNFVSGAVGETSFTCMWRPTKGKDGTNERYLDINVADYADYSEPTEEAESNYDYERQNVPPGATRITDVSGPWDAGYLVGDGELAAAELVFRKGTKVVSLSYDGTDKSYGLEDGRMPIEEAEAAAKKVAEEIAPKL